MMMMGGMELLVMLFFAGGPLSDIMGLPPGDRDANLVHAAAKDSLLYFEWSERGEGKPGGDGVDGLVADPEVKAFFDRMVNAVRKNMLRNVAADDPNRALMSAMPEFVLAFSGRPGCLFLSLSDEDPPQGDAWVGMAASVRAALVINAGDDADDFGKTIGQLLSQVPGVPNGAELDRLRLPLPIPTFLHRHDNYLILAAGQGVLDEVLGRLKNSAGGLAENKQFAAAWGELGLERTGNLSWIDFENGAQRISGLLGPPGVMLPQVMEITGLKGIKHAMMVTGVVDGSVRSRIKATTDGKLEGLMTLISGRAITADDFSFVPGDSDVVLALSLDGQKFLAAMREVVDGIEPGGGEEIDQGIAAFEEEFGLNVQKDILDAFGHVITISNSPGDGGFVATMPVLTVEVRKHAGAFKTVSKIAAYIDKNSTQPNEDGSKRRARGEYLERKEFMDQRFYMMNFVGDDDFIVAPTFAVTRTHFMLSLHPQALKSRLRRMANKDSWKPFAFAPKIKGEAVGFSAVKTSEVLPKLYGFAPWIASSIMSMLQRDGLEMDAFDFPSAYALLPYLTDSESVLVRTADGVRMESEAPPFLGTLSTLPVLSTPLWFIGMRVGPPPAVLEAAPIDAADEPAAIQIR